MLKGAGGTAWLAYAMDMHHPVLFLAYPVGLIVVSGA
jgi:hypothetical protein